MLNLNLYIHSTGYIAPAPDPLMPVEKVLCLEPDYSNRIPPMQLRRMSKVVRMGTSAAAQCMEAAPHLEAGAFSIGTAMGCLQDTEIFLSKMVAQDEQMLTPTAFIQSTHNTVGGQIALLAGCRGHNMTFVHRGHSFEHALINAKLYLQDHPGETIVAGGIDELTASSHKLMQRAGLYSTAAIAPADILQQQATGTIAGEGAAFFTINEKAAGSLLKLSGLHLIKSKDFRHCLSELTGFIAQYSIQQVDIDLVVLGVNGNSQDALFYNAVKEKMPQVPLATFKQLCGEYATASAFALSLLVGGIATGHYPPSFFVAEKPARMQRILLVSHYCDCYSFWLLEAAGD